MQDTISSTFFHDALKDNADALVVRAESLLLDSFPGQAVVACRRLSLKYFVQLGHCERQIVNPPRPVTYRYWGGEEYDRLYTHYEQAIWKVNWQEKELYAVHLEWGSSGSRDFIVADTTAIAEEFILDVARKTHDPGDAILVFSSGCWSRSEALYDATQAASFQDLILAKDLKETIQDDFYSFLDSEERYDKLQIAWRRGALLIGPPGNGKTHCVRALVKELSIPCIYVQNLSHSQCTPEQLWSEVFERARGLTPCVLVLEDLDALVTDAHRSFFLNQLDGFEQNHGLIVLATTNYPERIDSAIINRPSRFDRKYHFNLPTEPERKAFLSLWQKKLEKETGWSAQQVNDIALQTDGFSFAYLKELVISAVMSWMNTDERPFLEALVDQANLLSQQMNTEAAV